MSSSAARGPIQNLLPLHFSHAHAPTFPTIFPLHYVQINSVDIDVEGKLMASGGADRLVKVWLYDEGDCIASGAGHSGAVTKVKISPNGRIVVSVGAEGAIMIWKAPAV